MRNKIIAVPLQKNEYGYGTHPDYFSPSEEKELGEFDRWLKENELMSSSVLLDDDPNAQHIAKRYFNLSKPDINDWEPVKPDDEKNWFIGSIHETLDGPICVWLCHIS